MYICITIHDTYFIFYVNIAVMLSCELDVDMQEMFNMSGFKVLNTMTLVEP